LDCAPEYGEEYGAGEQDHQISPRSAFAGWKIIRARASAMAVFSGVTSIMMGSAAFGGDWAARSGRGGVVYGLDSGCPGLACAGARRWGG